MGNRILPQSTWVAPDFVAETFGRLTTISSRYKPKGAYVLQDYRCICGNLVTKRATQVKAGLGCSCGCYRVTTTNGKRCPTARSWKSMHDRCYVKTHNRYKSHGARGIYVVPEWHGKEGYRVFVCEMGERPTNTTLNRKDNDGPYCKNNCEWADDVTQANNRRNNRRLEFNGRNLTIAEWSREVGISQGTIWARVNQGWEIDRVLTSPVRKWRESH
jgi:hypothetical protein